MKKVRSATIVALVALFAVMVFSLQLVVIHANPDYSVSRVNHWVSFLGNGDLLINDTVQISGQTNSFLIGFPIMYGQTVLKSVAFDTVSNASLDVTLNVPLEDRVNFYGVDVTSPQALPQVFTVAFILDNSLVKQNSQNSSQYAINFPAFPSLTKNVDVCNASILAPAGSEIVETAQGSVETLEYSATNLAAFTYKPSQIILGFPSPSLQIFNINNFARVIQISELGGTAVSDTYSITNQATSPMTDTQVPLICNASNVVAEDKLGRTLNAPELVNAAQGLYSVSFATPVTLGNSTGFTVSYSLPRQDYTKEDSTNSFTLNVPVFENFNYYVGNAEATVILPEGARLASETDIIDAGLRVSRSVFQLEVGTSKQGLTPFDQLDMKVAYDYNPLWASFRPTLWIWAIAVVIGIAGMAWVAPRPKAAEVSVSLPSVTVGFSQEELRSFVDSYEEKRKIAFEIESLEERVQKGRIPRRRYKVQKRTLETRLESISRSSSEFKEKMKAAGGQNAELVVQLEVAEAELDEIASNIRNAELLHRRSDLSLEVYRKRMEDFERRREKADNVISGILLRLREEIR
jgi:hypothetical protein